MTRATRRHVVSCILFHSSRKPTTQVSTADRITFLSAAQYLYLLLCASYNPYVKFASCLEMFTEAAGARQTVMDAFLGQTGQVDMLRGRDHYFLARRLFSPRPKTDSCNFTIHKNCALLGCYTTSRCNSFGTPYRSHLQVSRIQNSLPLKMGSAVCTETSVRK